MLIAAFLGLAAVAASALTSIGHADTHLTEKPQAQAPARTGDGTNANVARPRLARSG